MTQSKAYQEHFNRIERYIAELKRIYAKAMEEYSALALRSGYKGEEAFRFEDFPELKAQADRITRKLAQELYAHVEAANRIEWDKSAEICAKVIESALPSILGVKLSEIAPDLLSQALGRAPAYSAFQNSLEKHGLSLSERVWKLSQDFKSDTELTMTVTLSEALKKGTSADRLSRQIRHLLNDPNALFRRVRDANGKLQLSAPAKAYVAGQGRYRSAYKNAMRLTRSVINNAYRSAEQQRMNTTPIVVGKEVHRSNHPYDCPVCEALKGKYPKDFDLGSGWHPQCRCYITWIMATKAEIAKWIKDGEKFISANIVQDVPQSFKDWIRSNRDKIKGSISRGTEPYFVRDNFDLIQDIMNDGNSGVSLYSGNGDAEITDDIFDYHLPKEVRQSLDGISQLKTYSQIKDRLSEYGIALDTDLESLAVDKANVPIDSVSELGQKILVGIETYRSIFGKDSLKKLNRVVLYDEGLKETAAYHYNELGENDPLAGTIRFRDWSAGGREVFHELAHAFQDSMAHKGEDAVTFSNRIVKSAKLPDSFSAYSGAAESEYNAERFSDAFAYAFVLGKGAGVRFLNEVYILYRRGRL